MKRLLAGLGLGIGVGLLIAPRAGSETRRRAKAKLNELADQVGESVRPLKNAAGNRAAELSEAFQETSIVSGMGEEAADNAAVLEFLNSASKTKLMSISGIGDATARRIMDGRQYVSHDSVVADGMVSEEIMAKLRKTVLSGEELEEEAA